MYISELNERTISGVLLGLRSGGNKSTSNVHEGGNVMSLGFDFSFENIRCVRI